MPSKLQSNTLKKQGSKLVRAVDLPFRIFDYYNSGGYFVICMIDRTYKTNKQ